MKKAIAIGILGLAFAANHAAAQSAVEQSRILRDFDQAVVEYSQRHTCLSMLPEAVNAATPAPKIFTLPVAMVFRQLIAHALDHSALPAISGVHVPHRAVVWQPFPTHELSDFPTTLRAALPALPGTLEYRMLGNDLVLRDTGADIIVGVLRDAVGNYTTARR
jgi:hypothetical protein